MVLAARPLLRIGLPLVAALVVAAAIVPFAFGSMGYPGAAHRATSGVAQVWSYGSGSNSTSYDNTPTYAGSYASTYRWSFVVHATNNSSTALQLESWSNTSSVSSSIYCLPSCTGAVGEAWSNSSYVTADHLAVQLTSLATVTLGNGSSVSALGIASAQESYAVTDTASFAVHGNLSGSSGGPGIRAGTFAATAASGGWIDFGHSALGLVPWDLPHNYTNWTTTSPFTADIAASASYNATGAFVSNGSGGYYWGGGVPTGIAYASPSNVSPGAPVVYPNLLPFFLGGAPSLTCPWNASTVSPSTSSASCRLHGAGNESVFGANGWAWISVPPVVNGTGASGSPALPAVPYGNGTGMILVEPSGPLQPGAAVSTVLPGSDLFGGAVAHWPTLNGMFYGYGVPGSGGGGGAPLGAGPTPVGSPPSRPGPVSTSPPSQTPAGSGMPWMSSPTGISLLAFGLLGAGAAVGAVIVRAVSPRPPSGGTR